MIRTKEPSPCPRLVIGILAASMIFVSGCNRNNAEEPEQPETEQTANAVPDNFSVSGTADKGRDINFIRSPQTGSTSDFPGADVTTEEITTTPAFSDNSSSTDETAPQFFDVEDPLEPVMGYCDNDMCDRLIEQLNKQRKLFDVGTVTKNSSLCVAADVRAREYSIYPVYKQRPDGRSFTSVSPAGYVRNEYFIVPSRNSITPVWDAQEGMWTDNNPPYKEYTYTPATVMEGLMEIREARNILLNEDYKQVGASWFVNGGYFIAGFTFSY